MIKQRRRAAASDMELVANAATCPHHNALQGSCQALTSMTFSQRRRLLGCHSERKTHKQRHAGQQRAARQPLTRITSMRRRRPAAVWNVLKMWSNLQGTIITLSV